MTTFNPFKINSSNSQNNTNSFLSNKFNSNISNNNPFLSQNNQSSSSFNPFISTNKNNSVNNNIFQSQSNTNPFLNSLSNNDKNKFSSMNNNNNYFNNNNSNNNGNPFLSNNNNNINNPFLKSTNNNNISNNNYNFNSNNNIFNNNQNNSSISNPFNSSLNNNNIFNNYGNKSIFNSTNNNSISFGFNNNNNSNNNISFGFNINSSSNLIMNNSQNNNYFFGNSKQFSHLFNNDKNNNNILLPLKNNEDNATENKNEDKNKIIPLSKILSLRFQSEDFLEEFLTKLNENEENAKLLTKSLNLNNYNDFIIESILSSKSKREEKREKEEKFNILKEKNMEMKKKRESIINEIRYQKYLKDLYKKNEKEDINRIIQMNSQKIIINNSEKKNHKRYSLTSSSSKNIEDEKEEDINNNMNNNNKIIIYKIFIIVYDDTKKKVFEKNIIIDKNCHYILDLDKLYNDITSTLKILKVNCRYGLDYKLNNFEIQKKIKRINLLEYEVQGLIKTENNYYKEPTLEINIISEKNISEIEASLNPQLHCKNDKNYILIPCLDIINKTNLFKYNKGLEVIFGNISIIFSDKNEYDFTNINFGELSYDGDYEIYFDESHFKKDNSSFKKLWEENISLVYHGLETFIDNNLKEREIVMNYLSKRYSSEINYFKDGKIILITKLRNLFLTEKERKNLFSNNN